MDSIDDIMGDLLDEKPKPAAFDVVVSPDQGLTIDVRNLQVSATHIKELAPYMAAANNINRATEGTAPNMLADLNCGLMKTGAFLGAAKCSLNKSRTTRKNAEAIAKLDKFPRYCQENNIAKPTADLRDAFVDKDELVLAAADQEAYYEAVVEQLSAIKMAMIMAMSSIKAIVYNSRDSDFAAGNRVGSGF